jgi:hypothetical protein
MTDERAKDADEGPHFAPASRSHMRRVDAELEDELSVGNPVWNDLPRVFAKPPADDVFDRGELKAILL